MLNYALRAWRVGRRLPRFVAGIETPDVVVGSSPHLLTPLAAYLVSRHFRVPFVMEVRDLWPQTIIDLGKLNVGNPITRVLQVLERFLYRRAKRIITLLPGAHKYITACGIPQERIVWIPNGVDLSWFDEIGKQATSHEGFRVMYLGAHGQANALDVLVQAAKIVQDRGYRAIRFILVGDGAEKPRLIELAERLKLRNFEFRDPVPKAEVPMVFREADAFILNLEEAGVFKYGISANKLFDYMAAARPVVLAVDASNNPVKEAECGVTVSPRKPEALAEAIIALSQMPKEEREAIGLRGREYVKEYHSVSVLADKFETCLKKVISD